MGKCWNCGGESSSEKGKVCSDKECSDKECKKDRKGRRRPKDDGFDIPAPRVGVPCANCGKLIFTSKKTHCNTKACKEDRKQRAEQEKHAGDVDETAGKASPPPRPMQSPPREIVEQHERILGRVRKELAKCVFDCICHRCGVMLFPSEVKWAAVEDGVQYRVNETFAHLASDTGELPYLVREKISAHRDEDTGAIEVTRRASCCYHCNKHPAENLFDNFGGIPPQLRGIILPPFAHDFNGA